MHPLRKLRESGHATAGGELFRDAMYVGLKDKLPARCLELPNAVGTQRLVRSGAEFGRRHMAPSWDTSRHVGALRRHPLERPVQSVGRPRFEPVG